MRQRHSAATPPSGPQHATIQAGGPASEEITMNSRGSDPIAGGGTVQDGAGPGTAAPLLFTPLAVCGLILKNRVVISPMCQHAATEDGGATDWHLVHLGKF